MSLVTCAQYFLQMFFFVSHVTTALIINPSVRFRYILSTRSMVNFRAAEHHRQRQKVGYQIIPR